eukprot:846699-Amphidinium_carterae.1
MRGKPKLVSIPVTTETDWLTNHCVSLENPKKPGMALTEEYTADGADASTESASQASQVTPRTRKLCRSLRNRSMSGFLVPTGTLCFLSA